MNDLQIHTPEWAARECRIFLDALLADGFKRHEAVDIICAWWGRSGTDIAALNAAIRNFAKTMRA